MGLHDVLRDSGSFFFDLVAGVKRLLMKLKSREIYSGRAASFFTSLVPGSDRRIQLGLVLMVDCSRLQARPRPLGSASSRAAAEVLQDDKLNGKKITQIQSLILARAPKECACTPRRRPRRRCCQALRLTATPLRRCSALNFFSPKSTSAMRPFCDRDQSQSAAPPAAAHG